MAQAGKGEREIGGTEVPGRAEEKDGRRAATAWPRKDPAGGKRKNENRRTDGRTLDKQGAIEINREYCEEYAQTRNSHSSSPSTFSAPFLLFPTSVPSLSFSLFHSLPLLPIPPMSPFSLSFVRTRVFSFPDLRRSFGIRFYKRTPLLLRSRLPAPAGA